MAADPRPPSPARVGSGGLWALVVAAIAARLAAGVAFPGFHTGDDVEIAESALASIGAIDYTPWPIRNQLLPRHLLGPVLALAAALGIQAPEAQLALLRSIFAVVGGGLTLWLTWRLGLRLFERRHVAILGAALVAFHPLALAFGASTLPRVVSTAAVLGAAVLVYRVESRLARRLFAAGVLVAVAFACRYSEAIFLAPLLALGISTEPRRWTQAAGSIVAGFAVGALVLVGIEDWRVFGTPFQSLVEFARYTLIEKQASSRIAVQPVEWYLRRILFWLPVTVVPALFFVDRSSRAVRALALWAVVPLLALSLVHHKDLRYLQGILPFVALLAAAGFERLGSGGGGRRKTAVVLVLLTVAFGFYRAGRVLIDSSNASVRAARLLAGETGVATVGVSQGWAFGGRILLREKARLVELGAPPAAESLRSQVAGLDAIAIHGRFAGSRPELLTVLARAGFVEWRTVSAYGPDRVTIFVRAAAVEP